MAALMGSLRNRFRYATAMQLGVLLIATSIASAGVLFFRIASRQMDAFYWAVWGHRSSYAAPPDAWENVCVALVPCARALYAANVRNSTEGFEWKTYTYPDDGFSASFPSAPSRLKQTVQTNLTLTEMRAYNLSVDPVALIIFVSDRHAAGNADPDRLLEVNVERYLANMQAHEISEKKITLGVHHGLELEAQTDRFHISARYYAAGTRLYQTVVVSPLESPYDEAKRFLDSFKLLQTVKA